jgi:AraC family transcriptional regulator
MEFRIEQGNELKMTGLSLRCESNDGSNFVNIPAFWNEIMKDGRYEALASKSEPSLGICGVCHSFEMNSGLFIYTIAIMTPKDKTGLPAGCDEITVPASTWAKFISRGPLHANFQNTIKRIYSEWFPRSGREHAGTAEIEFYPPLPDTEADDYWCEYWVPLK